jgi:hypothetical protein
MRWPLSALRQAPALITRAMVDCDGRALADDGARLAMPALDTRQLEPNA